MIGETTAPAAPDPELLARQYAVLMEYDLFGAVGQPGLDAVTRAARVLTGAPMSAINVLSVDLQLSLSAQGLSARHIDRRTSLCTRALEATDGTFYAPDLSLDPRFADSPWVDGRLGGIRLYAAAPLVLDGVPIGNLAVLDREPRRLGDAELASLADLAELVVTLLTARRESRLGEEARSDLVAVHEMLVEMQAFDQALLDALPVGVIAVGPTGELLRSNQESMLWHGEVGVAASLSDDLAARYRFFTPDGTTPLPVEELPLRQALTTGAGVRQELVMHPTGQPPRLVDCASTPVRRPDGVLIGAVLSMEDITERRAMEERLRTAALHDGLTGLPNRSLLADRMAHALRAATRDGSRVAVLYCDLDGFKAVNDDHGHAAGDQVLVEAAARLTAALRPGDTVARIGGDEFVLMCPGVGCADDAATIADRVTAAMAAPVVTTAGEHTVGVSVGVVLSQAAATPETLLTAADEAMYLVKRTRHGGARRR